jgi:hypothetical protein
MRTTCAVGVVLAAMAGTAYADEAGGCKKYEFDPGESDSHVNEDALRRLAHCNPNFVNMSVQNIFWIDNPTYRLSQIARVAEVMGCYDAGSNQLADRVLMCRAEEKRLDKAAFEAEVAATELDAAHKTTLRGQWATLQAAIEKANQAIAGLRGLDTKPVLETLEAGFKDWDSFYAKNQAVIDAAYAVEAKWWATPFDKRGYQPVDLGCAPVRAGWQQWVSQKHFKSAKEVSTAVEADELATIELRAIALCDMAARDLLAGNIEADLLQKKFPFRGPRMHAVFAAMGTLSKLIPENASPPMEPVTIEDEIYRTVSVKLRGGSSVSDIEQGKIAKITPDPKGVLVTFKKETWMEPDMQCYDLPSRYWSASEGRYKHDFACKKIGEHKMSSELKPMIFAKHFANGLKVGQIVSVNEWTDQAGTLWGFPIEARSGTKLEDRGKAKVVKQGNDKLQTGGSLDVVFGAAAN